MKYLFDSNILIESKNGFYAFDLCPGFWTWLKNYDEMRSIEKVKEEILDGDDDLSRWIENELPDGYFIKEDIEIQMKYRQVVNYVNALADFDMAKKNVFFAKADGWLIAAAKARQAVIVTHERNDPSCRRKILLPVIADAFGIRCMRITDVLRLEHICFH